MKRTRGESSRSLETKHVKLMSQPKSVTNLENLLQSSGLNEDCLVEIFRYLSVCDLLQLCYYDDETDKSITDFIINRVKISEMLFDLKQSRKSLGMVNRVFECFGHCKKRIRVSLILFA